MKLKFDVTAQEFTLLRDILGQHLPAHTRVWVFGSRAKHTARFNSDIDLALEAQNAIPGKIIAQLKDAFADAPLPYRVDLVDMSTVTEKFREIIRGQAVPFPMGDASNLPKLRFPEFQKNGNNSLRNVLFADLFSFSSGKNIKQDEASPNFETPCVRYGELYHLYGEVIETVINRTNIPSSELRFSDGDEILLPSAGEDPLDIGSASALTLEGVAIGRTINVLKPLRKNEYLPVFASYYINSTLKKRISCLARGSSISNVYNSDLKTLKINLPTLPEQRKIAAFLSAVDTKIAQLAEKKRLLEDYKKGCMQQLFSQKIRFKDEDGNDFPDWEEKKLGEVLKIGNGRDYKHLDEGDVPVYGTGGLMTHVDGFLYDGESVCIGRKGTIDKPALLSGKFWTVDTLFYTHSFQGAIPQFIYAVFQQINWQMHNEASGVPSLSKSTIEKLKIRLPHPNEQRKIADFLSALDHKIALVAEEHRQAQTFKKSLLQQMFV